MSTISDDKAMIERRINQKTALMEKKKDDFNYHTKEAKRLERVVHNLWIEIDSDRRKLTNLKTFPVTH